MSTTIRQDESRPVRTPRWQGPIAAYLLILAIATLVLPLLFAGFLMQRNHQAQEDVIETLVVATSRSLMQAVDREIRANATTLRVLAATPSLQAGDFEDFYDLVVTALAGTGTHLFAVNPDYTTFMTTRQPFGAPPSMTTDIDAAQRAFETGQLVVTDLVFGSISQLWVYNILLPVDIPGTGRRLLAFNQEAGNLSQALLSDSLPEGWNALLIDGDARIIAASPGAGETGGSFTLFDALAAPITAGWRLVATEAGPARVVVQRSRASSWRLVTWAPVAVTDQPLLEAMRLLVAGGVVLLLVVAGTLYWVSVRIGRSVRGLARDAERLGQGEAVEAKPYPVAEIADVSAALAEASLQRQAAEADVRFLMRELAHRSKNQMTVISAMAKQTARGEEDVHSYVQNFEKRILGLARSTDLLLTHGRAGVDLKELIGHQIDPFGPGEGERVTLEGEPVRLNAQAAQILGMAVHELSTNAVKYGAFSDDRGRLAVRWSVEGDRLVFVWREYATHAPEESGREGFGTTVLKSMVGRGLGAEVARTRHADGIEWRFDIPLAALRPDYAVRAAQPEDA